jgi:hypothetical protein
MFSAKQINSGQEILALLNCRRLPARLSTGETAVLLGFQEHDIAPLIAAKLLAWQASTECPEVFCDRGHYCRGAGSGMAVSGDTGLVETLAYQE